jgi:hypothetical protein
MKTVEDAVDRRFSENTDTSGGLLTSRQIHEGSLRHFQCLVRVPDVHMEPGFKLDVAGWTVLPGSDVPLIPGVHMTESQQRETWALGRIWARPEAVEQSCRSWVNHVLMNVFRVFLEPLVEGACVQLSSSSLPQGVLFAPMGSNEWTCGSESESSTAQFMLTEDVLGRLLSSNAFHRASRLLGGSATTSMQRSVLLAIVQWGEATRVGPKEIQLRSFLSVFEGLFDVDSHEDALDLVAWLICRADEKSLEPETVKEMLDELYLVRDRLLHEGFGQGHGASIVRTEDVYIARHFGRQAIMNVLLFHNETLSKRELVRELKELAA